MFGKMLCSAVLVWNLAAPAAAQDFRRWNGNIGGGLQFPMGETSRFSSLSGHFVLGAGANITRHLGMNGEFLWTALPIKQSVIDQTKLLGAHGFETALTINGIVKFPVTHQLGGYAIGGGGWYHRYGVLRIQQAGLVPAVVCGSFLLFWGVNCVSGLIPSDQIEETHSSNVFGGNVGAGLTMPIGDGSANLYLETRYHHAPHTNASTDNLLLTFGVRW